MSQVAVFIDAGYFWKQAGHVVHGSHSVRREDVCIDYAVLRQQLLQCVDTQFPNTRLLRIYWYDGPDMKGGKTSSHWAVECLDDFKLRLGMRSGSDQKQKAVDGLIIADIIGLAQSKAITGAMLLSKNAIPQQADAMLLRQGARHFKRKLTEPERRELRSAFKALLVS